ncbi:MAG TPA: hypothetical protein VM406_14255 [Noviherbaspirillum sp.]|nr:hypothetical protein [Noviherbaspirillum sp.]
MTSWGEALRRGALSGSIASLTSTAALAACGECEDGSPHAPTNAISHWLWGDRAAREDEPSLRYTGVGYAIHHASATFWAVLYEKWFGRSVERRELRTSVAGAAVVSGLACLVDYTITPPRLRPGYEKRLSAASLCLVYASFGAGLLLRSLATPKPRSGAPARASPPSARVDTMAI